MNLKSVQEWELAYDRLSELLSNLKPEAYKEALRDVQRASYGPSRGIAGRTTGGSVSDPTPGSAEVVRRERSKLRDAGNALDRAVRAAEDAASYLHPPRANSDNRLGYLRLAQRMGRL
jgi:hypothetical protein